MTFRSFLKSRIVTWLLTAVFVFVLIGFVRVYLQKRQIDQEIAKLQDQTNKIKKDNEQLSYLIKYYNTPQYQEKQAREKLNLKKDGEVVVGLPDSTETASQDQTTTSLSKSSNAKAWFNYFFHANQ